MIFCFGGEEEGGFQDGGGMVGHEGVGVIEAGHVLDCCCLSVLLATDGMDLDRAISRARENRGINTMTSFGNFK